MIRLARWDIVARSPAAATDGAGAMGRFAAPERRLGFWLALWAAVIAAEFGALVPVIFPGDERVPAVQVVYRLVGGSFAACGLIAWRRRPDSRSGLLMAVAGLGFFVSALVSQLHAASPDGGAGAHGALGAVLRSAAADAADGRPLDLDGRPVLVGGFVLPLMDPAVRLAAVLRAGRQSPGHLPERRHRRCGRQVAALAGRHRVRRPRGRRRAPVACGVAATAPRAAAERRGQRGAVALRRAADQRPRDRLALGGRAVGRGLSLVSVPAAFLVGLLRSRLARGGLADLFRDL